MTLIILLSLAVYRVTRFVILDTIIAHQRIWLLNKILGRKPRGWREKIHELLQCPFCLSVWLAGASVALGDRWVSVPLPWLAWLGVCTGTVVVWRFVEGQEIDVKVRMGSVVEHRQKKYPDEVR